MERNNKWTFICLAVFFGTWAMVNVLVLYELTRIADYLINYRGLG